jgi:hypothetical protein
VPRRKQPRATTATRRWTVAAATEAASLLRPAAEVAASPAVAAGAPVAPPVSADAGHPRASLAPFRELPAPDLQLLFQHFVI